MNIKDKLALMLRFLVWAKRKPNFYPSFNLSHSQFGEDMVIRSLTQDAKSGFYVDIGAHHPVYYSNTYHFYCKGWRGINIDAAPGRMELFRILRPRDINLEFCISPFPNSELTFFIFERPAFNTCDPEMAEKALSQGVKLVQKKIVQSITLAECLESYVSKGEQISFMTIDVEGMDEAILMSNDWDRYQPEILVFEKHQTNLQEINQLPIIQYLTQFGYELVAKCGPSLIFKK